MGVVVVMWEVVVVVDVDSYVAGEVVDGDVFVGITIVDVDVDVGVLRISAYASIFGGISAPTSFEIKVLLAVSLLAWIGRENDIAQ